MRTNARERTVNRTHVALGAPEMPRDDRFLGHVTSASLAA